MKTIELENLEFVSYLEFLKGILLANKQAPIFTQSGKLISQTIPTIYLMSNDHFKVSATALSGLLFTIASCRNEIILCFELYPKPFFRDFYRMRNSFCPIFKINRSEVVGFKRLGETKYLAFKPKKTLTALNHIKGAGFGTAGLLTSMLVKGAFRLAYQTEKSSIDKVGSLYALEFNENDSTKAIHIACESSYENEFEKFLVDQWTNASPK